MSTRRRRDSTSDRPAPPLHGRDVADLYARPKRGAIPWPLKRDSDHEEDNEAIYENVPRRRRSRPLSQAATPRTPNRDDDADSSSDEAPKRKTADELGAGWESESSEDEQPGVSAAVVGDDDDSSEEEVTYASLKLPPGAGRGKHAAPHPKPPRRGASAQPTTRIQDGDDDQDIYTPMHSPRKSATDSVRCTRARLGRDELHRPLERSRSVINDMGFVSNFLSDDDCRVIWMLLSRESQQNLRSLFRCVPMTAYQVDAMTHPVTSPHANRVAGIVTPIAKVIALMNYYYISQERLDCARRSFDTLIGKPAVKQLWNRLERMARSHGDLCMPTRVYGRNTVTQNQLAQCIEAIERVMQSSSRSTDLEPLGDLVTAFENHNMLFKTTQFLSVFGCDFYLRDLQALTEGNADQLRLICTEQRAITDAQMLSDVAVVISIGAALHAFSQELQNLYNMILYRLNELSETLYLTYLQMPSSSRGLSKVVREICVLLESSWHDCYAMQIVAAQLVKFMKRAIDTGLFMSPDYWKFAISQMVTRNDGTHSSTKISVDSALKLLSAPDLFASPADEGSRDITLRTLIVTKLGGTESHGRRIATSHAQIEDLTPLVNQLIRVTDAECETTPPRPVARDPGRRGLGALGAMIRGKHRKQR